MKSVHKFIALATLISAASGASAAETPLAQPFAPYAPFALSDAQQQAFLEQQRAFADASVTTTWTIDLHYPKQPACACDAFQSVAKHLKITPYPIPYRCLYSRNIDNLMMAGRNISVTHVALGTVRVQRTTGMMGEVLGMAASLCKRHDCTPREVYRQYLDELKAMMADGVPARSVTPSGAAIGASQ